MMVSDVLPYFPFCIHSYMRQMICNDMICTILFTDVDTYIEVHISS